MVKLGSNCITCYRYLKAPEKCMFLEVNQPCEWAGKIGEVTHYGSKEITYPQTNESHESTPEVKP